MTIHSMRLGMLQTNCYIIETDKKNAMVIDPGDRAQTIIDFCKKLGLTVKIILLTHGHYDHIGGVTLLKQASNADVYIHSLDEELLLNPDLMHMGITAQMEGYIPARADKLLSDGDAVALDEVSLKVMHTPGHSKGSCCFIDDKSIFSGDTIFAGSIGRSDLYGGDEKTLLASAKKIAALDGNPLILSGHGEASDLLTERTSNPFMGTDYDDIF